MERIPVRGDPEEFAMVHAVEDLRHHDTAAGGEAANVDVHLVDDVVGTAVVPKARRDGPDDGHRLVGLGGQHHAAEIVERGGSVQALLRVVGAFHAENESWLVGSQDEPYPPGALAGVLPAHAAVDHSPGRVEALQPTLEDIRVVVAGDETEAPATKVQEAERDAVSERRDLVRVVAPEIKVGGELLRGGRGAALAAPAAHGGEEGKREADEADQARAVDHDLSPEMISRTVYTGLR